MDNVEDTCVLWYWCVYERWHLLEYLPFNNWTNGLFTAKGDIVFIEKENSNESYIFVKKTSDSILGKRQFWPFFTLKRMWFVWRKILMIIIYQNKWIFRIDLKKSNGSTFHYITRFPSSPCIICFILENDVLNFFFLFKRY